MKTVQIRKIVFTALFAALFVVMSSISVPLGINPVPVTLQTLAVMLAGAFLGPLLGLCSILIVVALTAVGLPLLHGHGGIAIIQGPTGGFILMFPICALLVGLGVRLVFRSGLLSRSKIAGYVMLFIVFELFCSFAAYVGGVPWLAHVLHKPFSEAMTMACYPFVPGDTIKAVVAAIVTGSLYAYVPALNRNARGGVTLSD